MNNPPLKRHKALRNLSREHHDSLVFVLRLQKGVAKKVEISKMQDYIDWFWTSNLKIHFQFEEKELFPLLGLYNELVIKALQEHENIKKLVFEQNKTYDSITTLFDSLKAHIRFEERELFMRIQETLSKTELKAFGDRHSKKIDCGLWINRFW
jgi:hemerythrin-like domain-containing protein